MNLPATTAVKTAEEARDLAIEWQSTTADENMSWGEAIEYAEYFAVLGRKFDLIDEFIENGIV
jgi:hypothetical protein